MSKQRIVVWDARGPARGGYAEAEVVEEGQQLHLAVQAGLAVALPCDPELFAVNPAAGFFRRSWGRGEVLQSKRRTSCPMVMWAASDRGYVHWAARLVATTPRAPSGYLRLAPLAAIAGAFSGGLAATSEAVDMSRLEERQELPSGGWIVGGVVGVTVHVDGYLGLQLAGTADGVAVLWSAVTQCGRSS